MKRYLKPVMLIVILQLLAFLTSFFVTKTAVNSWYKVITKSSLTPPDWVFGPVWTILYTMLAIALWKLWQNRHAPGGKIPLAFFLTQLVLNYTWSPVFFGQRAFTTAFVIIVVTIICTALTMATARNNKPVFWLLAPYLAWLTFAAYLNFSVMYLN